MEITRKKRRKTEENGMEQMRMKVIKNQGYYSYLFLNGGTGLSTIGVLQIVLQTVLMIVLGASLS